MKKNNESVRLEGDTHWKATLWVMVMAQFLSGVAFSFVLPFFPFYFRELGLHNDEEVFLWIGYAALVFGVTMAVSAPLWGLVADRYGRKLMVIRSMFAGSIVLALMGLATNPWHIIILRFLQGLTTGTIAASVTLVSSVTPAANLGFSLGLLQTSLLIGNAVGPFAGGILADHFGYRIPCGLGAVTLLIGTLLVIFFVAERFVPPRPQTVNGFRTMRDILRTDGFISVMVVYFMLYTLGGMIIPVLPIFIEQLAHDPSRVNTISGTFVAVVGLLSGVSAAYFGKIGDRFGHSRTLIFALMATGVVSIPQAFAHNLWELFLERCLFGLAIGGVIPAVNVIVSTIIPKDRVGSAYGLTSSVTCLGIGAGPAVGGAIAAAFGIRSPFLFMGVFAFTLALALNRVMGGRFAGGSAEPLEEALPPIGQSGD